MAKLKILIVEYITGGGLNDAELPQHLQQEGLLMLNALLDNLDRCDEIDYSVMLDARMIHCKSDRQGRVVRLEPGQSFMDIYHELVQAHDAVWPIAPETDDILLELTRVVEQSGKLLLSSHSSAVAMTGNKWLTYLQLVANNISTIETHRIEDFIHIPGEWLIKPIDGVGCEDSVLVTSTSEWLAAKRSCDNRYLVQPHVEGDKISLSCLFRQGQVWLLCANRQHFVMNNRRYQLEHITVNYSNDHARYQALARQVAQAFPQLWGYAGIDLIETSDHCYVLEINPRLTTSFVGIRAATGINCAQAVLDLHHGEPNLSYLHPQPVTVEISH